MISKTLRKIFFVTSFLVLYFPLPLYAQKPSEVRSSDEASVVEKKIKEEAEEKLRKEGEAPPFEKKEVPEEVLAPGPRFFVTEIQLEGNTAISSEELKSLTRLFEGSEHTFSALKQLTQAIKAEYRKRGFITTQVYLPPQRLEKGKVLIRIVEGKAGEFQVEGNRFFRKKRILSYVKLRRGEILRYGELRRVIKNLNENPDRKVNAILKASQKPEASDLLFKVEDRLPLHAGFLFDNLGQESSGDKRFGFTVRDNNLTSFDDIFFAGMVFGKDFGAFFSQYLFPIPETDTKLIAGFSHAQVAPKKTLKPLGVNGISQTYFAKIDQDIFENDSLSLSSELSFEAKESRTRVRSASFRRERLRIIRFGPRLEVRDRWGNSAIRNEHSFGVNLLGAGIHAEPTASRQGVEPSFFRTSLGLIRNQRMPFGTRSRLALEFQIPSTKLPSSEGMSLGGGSSVRGYPEDDYIADMGALATFESYIPARFIPEDWQLPRAKVPLRKQIELVGFLDQGYGRLRGPSTQETHSRRLLGIGGGLRLQLYRELYARAEWAYAIGDHPLTGKDRFRFHFRLQAEF